MLLRDITDLESSDISSHYTQFPVKIKQSDFLSLVWRKNLKMILRRVRQTHSCICLLQHTSLWTNLRYSESTAQISQLVEHLIASRGSQILAPLWVNNISEPTTLGPKHGCGL